MGWKSSEKRTFTQMYCIWVWLSHSSQTASDQFWPSSGNIHKTWRQSIPMDSGRQADGRFCWYLHCGKICHIPFQSQSHPHQPAASAGNQVCPCCRLTLADEGRGSFPRMDPSSDEHHFLFSPWTQVCCSRKGQGAQGKTEKWRSLNCAPDVEADKC